MKILLKISLIIAFMAVVGFTTPMHDGTEVLTEAVGNIPAGTIVTFVPNERFNPKTQLDNCGWNQGRCICCYGAGTGYTCKDMGTNPKGGCHL